MSLTNYMATEQHLSHLDDNENIRVVYVSRITRKSKNDAWLDQCYKDAYQYNLNNNITGFYCKGDACFFECLEGRKKSIMLFIAKIYADKRYKKVKVISTTPIKASIFDEWCIYYTPFTNKLKHEHSIPPELHQYLPFKPFGWPLWYLDIFIVSMSKYKGDNGKHSFKRQQYYNLPKKQYTVVDLMSEQPLIVVYALFIISVVLVLLLL